jgi:hypothetical protein
MSWQTEISSVARVLINDLSDNPTYDDERLLQLILVAAKYVSIEMNFTVDYKINMSDLSITPDPYTLNDSDFMGFVALKSACLLDMSTLRTKAATEGIRASLGPASLSVSGNIKAYIDIIQTGPCASYENLKLQYEVGNTNLFSGILGPFSGNKFDPEYQRSNQRHDYRSGFF